MLTKNLPLQVQAVLEKIPGVPVGQNKGCFRVVCQQFDLKKVHTMKI